MSTSPRVRAWVLVSLVALAGCGSSPTSPGITLTSVVHDDGSGFNSETTLTVTDNAAWQSVWAQIHKGQSPQPALPAIDFGTETLLVASMGEQPTGGYGVAFGTATASFNVLSVDVTFTSPGQRCVVFQSVTSPVQVVRITRAAIGNRTIRFNITRRITNC